MSGNGAQTRIYIFVLVLNIVFPVLGYTFTTYEEEIEDYEISLDLDSLSSAGITFVDAESHNITYDGPWVEYVLLNLTIRSSWYADAVVFQKRSPIGTAFNTWLFPYFVDIKSLQTNVWSGALRNVTIIDDWDTEYNWSRFVLQDGHQIFVTPFATDGNITKAVFDDGHLNVTIARTFEEDESNFNFWNFIGWYTSLLIGNQSWGLPQIFGWFLRILAGISVFAVVMLSKELIRL